MAAPEELHQALLHMAITSPQPRSLRPEVPAGLNTILPGTTFADKSEKAEDIYSSSEPQSFDGPQVNGRPTTLTLFSPSHLVSSPMLPSLYKCINDSFRQGIIASFGNERSNTILRLRYDGQLHDELGDKPGTFTIVLHYSGTDEVVATASAKPHVNELQVAQISGNVLPEKGKSTMWKRLAPIPKDKVAWELSTMAVDSRAQRQGLASYLMTVAEDEVRRRYKAIDCTSEKQLILVITTNKERNGQFYQRRGFAKDYEIWYEKGYNGNERGFHVIFMSKPVDV